MDLKKSIEGLYTVAVLNSESPASFASKMLEFIGEDESREKRSNPQSAARWVYLTMVANILNDRGWTHEAKGIDIPMMWNKDLLYHIYWQTLRHTLYPKKKRQLNTKEFCNLVEHIMMLFAMEFDIHIPFPNMQDFLMKIKQ